MADESNKVLHDLVKEQTTELSRMNERLFLATKAARIGVWDWDIPKNELSWDDSMYRLYGIKNGDFGGAYDAWVRTIHPEDKERTEGEIQAALRGEREYAPEFRIIRPDGTIRYIKADSQTFLDEKGKPLRMIGTNIDITERKQAEEALYKAEQMYRALIVNSPDIIARYDRDCRRTYVNPAYLKVAQVSPPELLATAPEERSPLPAASAKVLQNLLRRVLDSSVAEAVDVIWPKSDNIDNWYNIYAFPEFDREGHIVSVMTVSRDITERKRGEEKTLLLNEELEQRVRERTKELERRNHELEQMNKAFVGRELKMVELKERNRELEEKNP